MHRSIAMRRSKLIDLNVLPVELRPLQYPRWYVLGLAAILTGCVLLVPGLAIQHSASQETSRLRGELAVVTSQLNSAGLDIGKERGLRAHIADAEAAVAALENERASLPGASGPFSKDMSLMYTDAPAGVSITSIARADNDVTISGESLTIENVIAYAKALRDSGSFADVTITEVTGGIPALKFAIQVAQ